MHDLPIIDKGRSIDWGLTSEDYAQWRPNYPPCFYERLAALGVGLPGQRILDLATGVGFLARNFAKRGADVTGIDIAQGQVEGAQKAAQAEGLEIRFFQAPAEDTGLDSKSFDVITASQCFPYFDKSKVIPEVKRLLAPGGVLVTAHFCWLPRLDSVAKASEALVLKYNPAWSSADWHGIVPPTQSWAVDHFTLRGMFVYDTPVEFTRARWRGRMRACRGTGATLSPERLKAFDDEHKAMLEDMVEEPFTVLHRVDAHIYSPDAWE